jgi:hypothetical protein
VLLGGSSAPASSSRLNSGLASPPPAGFLVAATTRAVTAPRRSQHFHQDMKLCVSTTLLAAALAIVGCSTAPKAAKSIEQVMEEGFEGKESLCAKVSKGQGSAQDLETMVGLTYQLTLNTPPKGDLASWTEKTTALHAAAKALAAGAPGAADQWKSAVNCKACHSVHKPD